MLQNGPRSRGFALVEAGAAVGVILVLAIVLVVASSETRRCGMLTGSLGNLKQYASGTASYAEDNADRFWAFSWQPGRSLSEWPDLTNALSDHEAFAHQAIDIIRRRSWRPATLYLTPSSWSPLILYSHLPLLDYLNADPRLGFTVSPADAKLRLWQTEATPEYLGPTIYPDVGGLRWPFTSSYDLPPAFWSVDQRTVSGSVVQSAVATAGYHNLYDFGSGPFRGRLLSEVAFPSQKAHVYDRYQRHFGARVVYYGFSEARLPVLMVDGSAGVRRTGSTNPGFSPNSPTSANPSRFTYQPGAWEPAATNSAPNNLAMGYYQFTRGGLKGRDVGGPEINTGNP